MPTLPALPSSPQTINVVDVAGNLALTQKAIEKYRADHAKTVSRITFTKAPAPELAGKLKAQQDAGRVDIDLVLTGTDGLAAGIEQGLWIELLPEIRRQVRQPRSEVPARRGEDAEARRGPRRSPSPTTRRARCSSTCPRR